jgi:hypothetical protein
VENAEKAARIKVNPNIDGEAIAKAFSEAEFAKKKMANCKRMIAIAGLPK